MIEEGQDEASIACDLLVVGGGINGAGIARDAAGRGMSVLLCEKDDLAAHTSSASTKLIHGGLRYLEHYEFGLVRKALLEREVLLRNAPHIMWPLRFVMPHDAGLRPAWMVRAGLFLYDHLARRELLPGSEVVALDRHPAGGPLQPGFRQGFVYSDGWVDDARLVVLNCRDAADRGARIFTRTECVDVQPEGARWRATLRGAAGREHTVRARALVNAAGPWAAQFLSQGAHHERRRSLRLIKGSHIVVPRLFDHPFAYILQNPDRRIVFAIPYEERFTLVGTTDVEFAGSPDAVAISSDETAYLCSLVNRYFRRSLTPADVVWSYSGVRPLLDDASGDPSEITRDYALELDRSGPPLLSVWGGKITTYRRLAEEAVDQLAPVLGTPAPAWTQDAPLPGGDLRARVPESRGPGRDFEAYRDACVRAWPWIPAALIGRWCRAYGSRIEQLLEGVTSSAELGTEVAPGVFEIELRHLRDQEWARTGDDVLWRRSKLGLHLTTEGRQRVIEWFEACA